MGRAVQEMLDEEAKPNLTPMIDVVFLLLIFFMLMKFKTYEMKLDSHLPKDEGMEQTDPDLQENLTVRLVPNPGDPTRITVFGVNQSGDNVFSPIPWQPVDRQEGERTVQTAHPQMFRNLETFVLEQLNAGSIDKKIVLDPDPLIPFDYVALTLDAVHKAHRHYVGYDIIGKIEQFEREANAARMEGHSAREFEHRLDLLLDDLHQRGAWKEIVFAAPPMDQ